MTSNICGLINYSNNDIFKIIRIDRLKRNTCTYIFIGDQSREIKNLLTNLELTGKPDNLLKKHFSENYERIVKNKTSKIKFIYHSIYPDDTITTIRKKIFCFISNNTNILIPENQELWVKLDKTTKMLGPTWTDIPGTPSILQDTISPDHKNFVAKDGHMILIQHVVNINEQTLYDATDGIKFENGEIYLHMLQDEMEYCKSIDKKIDDILINGYFIKYWASALIDYDPDIINKELERLRPLIIAEDKLIRFIDSIPIDYSIFNGCKIIQILLHITNDYQHEFINLKTIFSLFKVDEKTPFMRYKDQEKPAPLFRIYKPLVDNKIIGEKQIRDWVSTTKKVKNSSDTLVREIQYSSRGLTLKRYIYTLDDQPKYATINIHRNGNMEVRIAFKEKYGASLKDVYNAVLEIGKLISKVNEIDYRYRQLKIHKNIKLLTPSVSYNEKTNLLEFHGRTRLILMDVINEVNLPDDLNYKDINTFSNKYMTPFVSPILSKRDYEKTELLSKYKRVSFYSRMNLEYEFIHKTVQQNPGIQQSSVIKLLHESYYSQKPLEDAIKVYKDWERRYGFMGSQGIKNTRQTGIEIKIKNGKMHLNGSKNIMQLTNVSIFIAKFLNLFINQNKYIKKSTANDIFSDELIKLDDVNNEITANIINNSAHLTNANFMNYANTLGNLYAEDEYINTTNAVANEDNNNDSQIKTSNDFNRSTYLARDSDIDRNIRMQCEDKDLKHDVCTDFCEDEFYTLRRLQKYDNPIFRFRSDAKFANYAKQCQPQERQPIVLKNDPATNPKIDPESYKNAIRYGSSSDRQNWYICAQVWCPFEEIPILYNRIKNNIKIRPTRKGNCLTAKCPSCLENGQTTWLKIVEDNKFNPYIGFIDDSNHPNQLCMPCCFKIQKDNPKSKGYHKFMKCLGKNVDSSVDSEGIDYVMGRDKIPLLRNRFGLLPTEIAKLFNSRYNTGKIQVNMRGYLRYGVKDDIKQSFLYSILSIIEDAKNETFNMIALKKYLFETKLTNRMYNSLNNGELKITFGVNDTNSIDNFVKYMMSDTNKINEEFLWDFLSRPGILHENGINIYILNSRALLCPVGFNVKDFYSNEKMSAFIYTDGRYYEPIFFVSNEKGKIKLKRTFFPEDRESSRLFDMSSKYCISKYIISWDKIRKDSLKDNYFEVKKEVRASTILKNYNDEKIIGQIKDSFNKSIGFITENGFFLPYKPQGELVDIPIVNYRPKKISKTISFYNEIARKYNYPYKPIRIFKDTNGLIIAILLENNRIIHVIQEKTSTDLIEYPGKYYINTNKYIAEKKEKIDERILMSHSLIYQNESFERLRIEIAKYLQASKEKDVILNIVYNKELKNKREKLYDIIDKICKKLVVILDDLPFNIENYVRPPIRKLCGKVGNRCTNNPHCYYSNGECRLIILKRSPIDGKYLLPFFINKITDDILRNSLLRDEILEDKLDEILNNDVEIKNDEILIDGAKNVFNQIKKLYEPKKEFLFNTEHQYSKVHPKYDGINKEKYLLYNKDIFIDKMNLMKLPSYWKSRMPSYHYYSNCNLGNSLYNSMLHILSSIMPEIKTVNQLKKLQINKIENISVSDINKEPILNDIGTEIPDGINRIINIYKHFNRIHYKSINTITQLKEFIMTDDYPANIIDIYLLSQAIAVNIIILEKRIKKSNNKGFYSFIYSIKRDTVLLLENFFNEKICYNIVGRNDNYIFKMKNMPNDIKKYYGLTHEIENNNNNK